MGRSLRFKSVKSQYGRTKVFRDVLGYPNANRAVSLQQTASRGRRIKRSISRSRSVDHYP
jgi:hypothetical protein